VLILGSLCSYYESYRALNASETRFRHNWGKPRNSLGYLVSLARLERGSSRIQALRPGQPTRYPSQEDGETPQVQLRFLPLQTTHRRTIHRTEIISTEKAEGRCNYPSVVRPLIWRRNCTMTTAGNIRVNYWRDRAVAQGRLVAGFPPRRPGFVLNSDHVGFVLDKAALGLVFSEYFGFHCQAFRRLLYTHHPSLSGAGTIGR
jgi:hypothetical protein